LRRGAGRRYGHLHKAKHKMSIGASRTLLCAVLLLGFAGVWRLQHGIDAQLDSTRQEQDDLTLRSGALVKALSLEYAPLAADLYWTRVVQYYGAKHEKQQANLELLWPLLDVTTTLDPNLIVAYRFGGMFLSDAPPRGAGKPEQGIELLRRGIRNNPEYWRFYEDLGFIYYFDLGDYPKAAEVFLEGSKRPGAMIWMKTFAARISEKGESPETSRMLWSEIYNSASEPSIKENAKVHLQLLRARADCEQLNKLAEEYKKRAGHRPTNMRDLVKTGLLPGLAVDPVGTQYWFDREGKAQINPASPLFKEQRVDNKRP
jgi:tetratricopeptide (TPR) repeat protein